MRLPCLAAISSNTLWTARVPTTARLVALPSGRASVKSAPGVDGANAGWIATHCCSTIAEPLLAKVVPQRGQRRRIFAKDPIVVRRVVDMQGRIRHDFPDLHAARHIRLRIPLARHEQR